MRKCEWVETKRRWRSADTDKFKNTVAGSGPLDGASMWLGGYEGMMT